jgi:SAM-dependent methyltransferase
MTQAPRLYRELAAWWPLMSAPEDYEEEAGFYARILRKSCDQPPATVLELGSGGGNNAWHLKREFALTLVDNSPGMLAVSRALNPDCEHLEGDMRSLRLDRQFDAVFIHDAIMYMTNREDLLRVLRTANEHTRPGGAAVFAPDHVKETFEPSTECGGHDGPARGLRYLEWTWDPDPDDEVYTVDYAYLLRGEDGATRVEHDRHIEGLFSRETWISLMTRAGFAPERVAFHHSEMNGVELDVFVGRKPEG